jgi:hypothetical protein
MKSIPNNSKISIEPALTHQQSIECHHPKSPQSIACHHLRTIENRSILAGGVGRVRSRFLEFGDDYLHKPAPTDPITDRPLSPPTYSPARVCRGGFMRSIPYNSKI